jgi:HD superfamily phosphohydrolase
MGLADLPPHEQHAQRFLQAGTAIAEVLDREWNIRPADVLDVLAPRLHSSRLALVRSIISGPIDVDKLDYLERDSLHCGVPYGRNFDKQRLIQSLVVNSTGDGLAITSKGKTAAELMVFARYVMFSEVYWHHAVRAATTMFARAFFDLYRDCDPDTLFLATDAQMLAELRRAGCGMPAGDLLERVFGRSRRLHKRAAEFSELQSPEVYRRLARRPYGELVQLGNELAGRIGARLRHEIPPTHVLIDAPPPHREIEFAIEVYFPKQDIYRPLREVSPVVDALARTQFDDYVKRVRVFVTRELREALPDAAEWQQELERLLG